RREADLAEETAHAVDESAAAAVGEGSLEREVALAGAILHAVDRAHAALGERRFDLVAVDLAADLDRRELVRARGADGIEGGPVLERPEDERLPQLFARRVLLGPCIDASYPV